MLLCLSACGKEDPICGRYRCTGGETEGLTVREELLEEKAVLSLEQDGTGTLTRGDRTGGFSWARSGDGLRLDAGGRLYDARLEDGSILLPLEDGLTLRFEREDTPTGAEAHETAEWYGWWVVEHSEGNMPEIWRDC
jgi:hypothetical protein